MQKFIGIVLTLSFQTCWEKEKKEKKDVTNKQNEYKTNEGDMTQKDKRN
jgi:hypothetical protein